MTFEKYKTLVSEQVDATEQEKNLETNYSEFMFCVAYFCVARALKNMSNRFELSEEHQEVLEAINFDEYITKRRKQSLFLIPERNIAELLLKRLGSLIVPEQRFDLAIPNFKFGFGEDYQYEWYDGKWHKRFDFLWESQGIGENGLLSGDHYRKGTVVAERDCHFAILKREDWMALQPNQTSP